MSYSLKNIFPITQIKSNFLKGAFFELEEVEKIFNYKPKVYSRIKKIFSFIWTQIFYSFIVFHCFYTNQDNSDTNLKISELLKFSSVTVLILDLVICFFIFFKKKSYLLESIMILSKIFFFYLILFLFSLEKFIFIDNIFGISNFFFLLILIKNNFFVSFREYFKNNHFYFLFTFTNISYLFFFKIKISSRQNLSLVKFLIELIIEIIISGVFIVYNTHSEILRRKIFRKKILNQQIINYFENIIKSFNCMHFSFKGEQLVYLNNELFEILNLISGNYKSKIEKINSRINEDDKDYSMMNFKSKEKKEINFWKKSKTKINNSFHMKNNDIQIKTTRKFSLEKKNVKSFSKTNLSLKNTNIDEKLSFMNTKIEENNRNDKFNFILNTLLRELKIHINQDNKNEEHKNSSKSKNEKIKDYGLMNENNLFTKRNEFINNDNFGKISSLIDFVKLDKKNTNRNIKSSSFLSDKMLINNLFSKKSSTKNLKSNNNSSLGLIHNEKISERFLTNENIIKLKKKNLSEETFKYLGEFHSDKKNILEEMYFSNMKKIKNLKMYFDVYMRKSSSTIDYIIQDVSEKKIKEDVTISKKINKPIFAKLAHEFKTPLNSIISLIGNIQNYLQIDMQLDRSFIDKNIKIEENLKKDLSIIYGLSNYTLYLISDLIQYSDSNNINREVQILTKDISLKKILNFCFEILKALISCNENKSKLVNPILEIDHNLLEVNIITDEFRLNQILLNLISNAVKFTKFGSIIIKANINLNIMNKEIQEERNNLIVLSIKDSGIGIKKQQQNLIFKDENNININYELNKMGSGLGLIICKDLAQKLDYKLYFDSVENEGTIFFLEIPVTDQELKISNRLPLIDNSIRKFSISFERNLQSNVKKDETNSMSTPNEKQDSDYRRSLFSESTTKLRNSQFFKPKFMIDSLSSFSQSQKININNSLKNKAITSANKIKKKKKDSLKNQENLIFFENDNLNNMKNSENSYRICDNKITSQNNPNLNLSMKINEKISEENKKNKENSELKKTKRINITHLQFDMRKQISSNNLLSLNKEIKTVIERKETNSHEKITLKKNSLLITDKLDMNVNYDNLRNLENNNELNLKFLSKINDPSSKSFFLNSSNLNKKSSNILLKFKTRTIMKLTVENFSFLAGKIENHIENNICIPCIKVIILIDDNKHIRESIKNLIEKILIEKKNLQNFEILEGNDGIDILKFVIDPYYIQRIKLIITDENMEYMNGSYAIRYLRNMEKLNKIPKTIIFSLTSYDDFKIENNILSSGCDMILRKPLSREILLDELIKRKIL